MSCSSIDHVRPTFRQDNGLLPYIDFEIEMVREDAQRTQKKTGPEEAQYFHVRPPIGFI